MAFMGNSTADWSYFVQTALILSSANVAYFSFELSCIASRLNRQL